MSINEKMYKELNQQEAMLTVSIRLSLSVGPFPVSLPIVNSSSDYCSYALTHCSSALTHCSSALTHCSYALTHCSSALTHCSSALTHCSYALTHCSHALTHCFSCSTGNSDYQVQLHSSQTSRLLGLIHIYSK